MVYKTLVSSKTDSGSQVYASAHDATLRKLDVLQNKCLPMCPGALKYTWVVRLEVEANAPPHRVSRDHLPLTYGTKMARKRNIKHPA